MIKKIYKLNYYDLAKNFERKNNGTIHSKKATYKIFILVAFTAASALISAI